MADPEELLAIATEAARAAGELLLERFGSPSVGVSAKSSPTDLVSDADRDAERRLLEIITTRRPTDGLLTEETGARRGTSGLTWVIDPLDGTINFLFGLPMWCVSLAVEDETGPLVAVTHDPNRSETFTAARSRGTFLNDSRIRVTDQQDLAVALVATGFAYDAEARTHQADLLRRVLPRVRDIRRAGSAALDLAWLACGRFDGFYEAPMKPWDKAAGVLLVAEAGGVVSDLPAPLGSDTGVIAANARLHDELKSLLLG